MHKSIEIRDYIASAIANTAVTIHTSRAYAVDETELPVINIVMGEIVFDEESIGDDIQNNQQDYTLQVLVASSGDVDAELFNRMKEAQDTLASDPEFGGLVQDSYPVAGSPAMDKTGTKLGRMDLLYRVTYTTESTNQ